MVHFTNPVGVSLQLPPLVKPDSAGGAWHFRNDFPFNWVWSHGAFSNDELDAIIRIGNAIEQQKGLTGNGDLPVVRDSFVSWLYPNEVTTWVFERLQGVIEALNNEYFRFDLDGLFQGIQFTKYTAPGQHYTWHTDRGPQVGVRKLSISIQLSNPNDYDGGDLQLRFGEQEETASRERGMVCLFPSWTLHRVTPVTKGTRYSLVAWVSGPAFR